MAAPLGKPQREGLDPASLKAGGLLCGPVGMMGLGELRNPRPLGAGGHPRQASGQEPLSVPLRDPGPCCPDPAVVGSRACEHGARGGAHRGDQWPHACSSKSTPAGWFLAECLALGLDCTRPALCVPSWQVRVKDSGLMLVLQPRAVPGLSTTGPGAHREAIWGCRKWGSGRLAWISSWVAPAGVSGEWWTPRSVPSQVTRH